MNGNLIDTRLGSAMIHDARLQCALTGEQGLMFITLLVKVTTLVNDGAFTPLEVATVADRESLDVFVKVGLLNKADDEEHYHICAEYQSWQTSKAKLIEQAQAREKKREDQKQYRSKKKAEQGS